jgi:hypothetical protein
MKMKITVVRFLIPVKCTFLGRFKIKRVRNDFPFIVVNVPIAYNVPSFDDPL